ncbi:hypothetical protein AB0M79_02545 [Polymorphospora sp. NPDC051019]|uniref:hypothetical protein n=1 Tax=Polymorphospora sp. NPDC051019 TaxID=3155725 RepID=UPI0034304315
MGSDPGSVRAGKDRFARWESDGTWARIEQRLQTDADACGDLGWRAQVDSSVVHAHQHAAEGS